MGEATPRPWGISGGRIEGAEEMHTNGYERNKSGHSSASWSKVVCSIHGSMELPAPRANAEFIIRAVNSHEELVAKLADLEALVRVLSATDRCSVCGGLGYVGDLVRDGPCKECKGTGRVAHIERSPPCGPTS